MSSTIIDSPDAGPMVAASPDVDARDHHRLHRAWLVAVAVVAAATLGLTLGWQATARSSGSSAPATGTSDVPATRRSSRARPSEPGSSPWRGS